MYPLFQEKIVKKIEGKQNNGKETKNSLIWRNDHIIIVIVVGFIPLRILKVDMSKAYYWMKWDFICETLDTFGFQQEFVQIIRQGLGSFSNSILMIGSLFGNMIRSKDLRQGTLFLLTF